MPRGVGGDLQRGEHDAHHRPTMTRRLARRGASSAATSPVRPHAGAGRGERTSLDAAGPVRDGVGQEHVGDLVERREPRRLAMRGIQQRQHAAPALLEHSTARTARSARTIRHFPALPRRLEPPRMRERRRSETPSRRAARRGDQTSVSRRGSQVRGVRRIVARARCPLARSHVARSTVARRTLPVARDSEQEIPLRQRQAPLAGCERSASPSAVTT